MEIRHAVLADAEAACHVLRRSIVDLCRADYVGNSEYLAWWLSNKTPEHVARWITNPSTKMSVVTAGDSLLGVGAMMIDGTVTLNYVAPEARFKGVSSRLLGWLEDEARMLGLHTLTLESTITAERFYRARGYVGDRKRLSKQL